MSLNIKSDRTVALVRQLATRTGASLTSAVEDAVARRLQELDDEDDRVAEGRAEAAEAVLEQLGGLLSDHDKAAIRRASADLYDDDGLPR